ncbi:enoyl-CoA hydratase [Microbaculum marinisediminis]|uniref:Enoyl-CoA hydratase domain-containing protein 3, mitochondrial n=1 Tax=Microbaculum marinisediminis TaxID=2931392 RepID=A0AAW5QYL1_9HYPH|nr:enoyl-CoA hydratase [Microbaculum sp. A6E488]MCT8973065.1 enoyl-CoA hydratase [Microbaculum sp. A6E488]
MSTAETIDKATDGSSDAPLLIRREDAVTVLTLNRPAARNALAECLLDALAAAFADLHDDAETKTVVLTGAPPAFCAGHDLREMTEARAQADRGRAYFATIFAKCSAVMQAIVACPKPVIAAVDGIATAAGCQLVATCDLAVAGAGARFATPGVNIGLFCSTPMVALTRNVSPKHAMEMLLTGEMADAGRAEAIGLVNRVVPEGQALEAAMALARLIADKSPLTVKTGKEAFYRQREMPLADAYAYTARVMTENMLARDAEEGIGAFLEKRKPVWTGS